MKIFQKAFGIQEKKEEEIANRPKSSSLSFKIDEQFMTPDFLYQSAVEQTNQVNEKKQSLSKQFYLALSSLENKFNQSPVKHIAQVDSLVGMYQECVQNYDAHLDPIKYYFLDKIKTILSQTDKFTQREPKQNTATPQKPRLFIPNTEVSYFKDFEDFTERIDKPTEYATPRNDEQFFNDNKLIAQLKLMIEDGDQSQPVCQGTSHTHESKIQHHQENKTQNPQENKIQNPPEVDKIVHLQKIHHQHQKQLLQQQQPQPQPQPQELQSQQQQQQQQEIANQKTQTPPRQFEPIEPAKIIIIEKKHEIINLQQEFENNKQEQVIISPEKNKKETIQYQLSSQSQSIQDRLAQRKKSQKNLMKEG